MNFEFGRLDSKIEKILSNMLLLNGNDSMQFSERKKSVYYKLYYTFYVMYHATDYITLLCLSI